MSRSEWFFLAAIILIVGFITFKTSGIKEEDAVDAIVGEASNQSYDTMLCIAQTLRHRGTLVGVYGFHAKHNVSENADTWEVAEDAWENSTYIADQVHGARNFASLDDLDSGRVRLKSIKAHCGDFIFY